VAGALAKLLRVHAGDSCFAATAPADDLWLAPVGRESAYWCRARVRLRGADLLPWGMVVDLKNEKYLQRTLSPIEKQRRDGGLSVQC